MTPSHRAPVAFFLPSLEAGGAERVMLNLAAGLTNRGFRTDLVLASASGPYLASVPPNVRVVDLKASRVLRSLRPLANYLRRERPLALLSALDHANLVAMAAGRLAGSRTRTVISIHCTFPRALRTNIRTRTIPWLLGRLHSWADGIVAVSEGVADDVARSTGMPRKRVSVIYNPVITPALAPAALARPSHPWFEDSTRPIVLSAGRLTPQKNFALLINAFALVRREHDARLVILGDGPERAALETEVRRHGVEDCVALPGFLNNPYACMARARVFALSSDFEGLPTVLIESLAVGTPVVSTDCESGPREILRGGALGELVPVGDVPALARAISSVLSNPRRPRPPAEALHPFTLDAVLDQFQEVLELDA
jgi:glycosyltransferase involved in cell wall biosynthesis